LAKKVDKMSTSKHIVRSYDEEFEALGRMMMNMGQATITQIGEAQKALINQDTRLAQQVVDRDQSIDELYGKADQHIINMLARRQPMANDLRVIIASQKIASELERIADYAANIAGHAVTLADIPETDDLPLAQVEVMLKNALQMLADAMQIYNDKETKPVAPIWDQDQKINAAFSKLIEELSSLMIADAGATQSHTAMLFIGRCCERMGDHIKNMAEHLHYMFTGDSFYPADCQ
jgi:phosphate transport system protein